MAGKFGEFIGEANATVAHLAGPQATGIRVRPGEDNPLAFRDDRSFDIHDATGKIGHLTGYLGGPWSDAEKDTEFRVTHVEISEPGRTLSPGEWKQVLHGLREHLPEAAELVGGNRGGEGGGLHPASEKLFRLPPPAAKARRRRPPRRSRSITSPADLVERAEPPSPRSAEVYRTKHKL